MIEVFTHMLAFGLGGLTALACMTLARWWTRRDARPRETPPQAAERRRSRARARDGYGVGRGGYRALTDTTAFDMRKTKGGRDGR